jgi:hypothetical protein
MIHVIVGGRELQYVLEYLPVSLVLQRTGGGAHLGTGATPRAACAAALACSRLRDKALKKPTHNTRNIKSVPRLKARGGG